MIWKDDNLSERLTFVDFLGENDSIKAAFQGSLNPKTGNLELCRCMRIPLPLFTLLHYIFAAFSYLFFYFDPYSLFYLSPYFSFPIFC